MFREITQGLRIPDDALRKMTEGVRIPDDTLRKLTEGYRLPPDAVRQITAATQMPAIPPETLRRITDGIRMPTQSLNAIVAATQPPPIPPETIKRLTEATRVPALRWADFFKAPVVPNSEWRAMLQALQEAADMPGSEELAAAAAEFDAAEAEVGNAHDGRSWLYRLGLGAQLGLIVAVVQLLDALGNLYADLAGEDVPSEVRASVQVMFAMLAVLLILVNRQNGHDE